MNGPKLSTLGTLMSKPWLRAVNTSPSWILFSQVCYIVPKFFIPYMRKIALCLMFRVVSENSERVLKHNAVPSRNLPKKDTDLKSNCVKKYVPSSVKKSNFQK